ncbi:hypothetical protein DXU06_27235 [Bradyrhizobium elkanii]|nr:hypothetical protein [Bradyrhizobium elkanii]QOZ20457.1 hypothetical protein XI02_39630 [Bradyrhizobium sp. CCBAU 21365]RYM33626.1 hypothetical protein EWH13_01050 [Bradyrhizobium elkanii]
MLRTPADLTSVRWVRICKAQQLIADNLREHSKMHGWLVTVAVFKEDGDDDEEFRHITYVVAAADPAEAVKLTVKDSGAKAAILNCPIEEEQLLRLGVKPGELLVIHDGEFDPIISRHRRH